MTHPSRLKTSYLLFNLTRSGWRWALLAGASNLAVALSEGATIGFLALALHALVGNFPSAGRALLPILRSFGQERLFLVLVLMAVGAQVSRSLLQFTGCWATAHLQAKVQMEGFQRIFRRIMGLPFQRAASYRLGDLTLLLQESQYLASFVSQFNVLLRSCLLAATYALILLCISWRLSLLAFLVYGLISFLLRRVIAEVGRRATSLTEATRRLHERSTEFVQGIRLIHTFGRQEEAMRSVQKISEQGMIASRDTSIWGSVLEPVVDSLIVLGAAFFLLSGYVWLGREARGTLPSLLAFLIALHRMSPRLSAIHTTLAAIASFRPHLRRIVDFLRSEETEEAPPRGARRFTGLRDRIELREVTLRYHPDEPPALVDFSCVIPCGSFVAFVGASGAGKSSVIDLLIRLYEPTSGQILIDGDPIQTFSLDSWRDRLGVVAQDPFLFHTSIWENIAFGLPHASREEILAAAHAAHVEEFIGRMVQGYDTLIGDRGCRLSGGQRQRIALARALVRHPEILILDEATSALDSESEQWIHRALENQQGRRTVIVIAHRLSTVLGADQILVLKQGRLMEKGTHQELLERQGDYAAFWRLQLREPAAVPILS